MKIKRGTTQKLIHLRINSIVGNGLAPLTALTSATTGLLCYFIREGGISATEVALSASTVGTWASGGFAEVDAVHMPGIYELGLPNAALSTGNSVTIMLSGALNMAACVERIELDAIDYQDGVRAGLTALPPVAASAANGLPTIGTGSGQISLTAGDVALSASLPANFATMQISGAGIIVANTEQFNGQAVQLDANHLPKVDLADWTGTAVVHAEPNTSAVTVAGYTSGQSPASLVLVTPSQKLVTDGSGHITVASNLDKSGYALTSGEHGTIQTNVQAALTAQGYTTTRAGYLDLLNTMADEIWDTLTSSLTIANSIGKKLADWVLGADHKAVLSSSAHTGAVVPTVTAITNAVQVGSYASGQDPVTLLQASASYKALLANVNGHFSYTPPSSLPGFGTLVLKDQANVATVLTATLTLDANGNLITRSTV